METEKHLQGYAVYRTDADDNTYCRDLYNVEDHSLNLLCSKLPIDIDRTLENLSVNNVSILEDFKKVIDGTDTTTN